MDFNKTAIRVINIFGYSLISLTTLICGIFLFTDLNYLKNRLLKEDGPIEYLTFVFLFAAGIVHFLSLFTSNKKKRLEQLGIVVFALLLILAAGEEISWGQRIFNFQSPGYFIDNNAQKELNFHNLYLGGKPKSFMNLRLDIGIFLSYSLLIFFCFSTILYKRFGALRKIVNLFSIPIPKASQAICYAIVLALLIIVHIFIDYIGWEFLEFTASALLLLLVVNPINSKEYLY